MKKPKSSQATRLIGAAGAFIEARMGLGRVAFSLINELVWQIDYLPGWAGGCGSFCPSAFFAFRGFINSSSANCDIIFAFRRVDSSTLRKSIRPFGKNLTRLR